MSTTNPTSRLLISETAFFFDIDGTLAEIQPRPDLVFIPDPIHHALASLQAQGAALAVVSGRPLEQIDALLQPLSMPAAGVHGAERRNAEGELQRIGLDEAQRMAIESALERDCARYPALMLENKGVAFALHFRQAPELESEARAIAEALVERYPALSLQPGKCVFELKPKGANKGDVVRRFMAEAAFVDRTAVFVGDDVTDEAAFEVANLLGGLSIKVGEGPTVARFRLASVTAVGEWLDAIVATNAADTLDSNA